MRAGLISSRASPQACCLEAGPAWQGYILHKCITSLTHQVQRRQTLPSLHNDLAMIVPDVQVLKKFCLEQKGNFFALCHDSTGQQSVQLMPLDVKAIEELLSLCSNVAVVPKKRSSEEKWEGEGQHDLAAWVAGSSTIILAGLQGYFLRQMPESILVLDFARAQLRLRFEAGPNITKAMLNDGLPCLVRVCLRLVTSGRPGLQVRMEKLLGNNFE